MQSENTDSRPTRGDADRQLTLGMSKSRVREVAGAVVDESTQYVWKLKDQFSPATPGLYPYFDSRQVYIYFDVDDSVLAINVRGSYNVYP